MTPTNWIEVAKLITEIIKTTIPFGFILWLFCIFKNELSALIKNGGWKVSAPGVAIEAAQKQQTKIPGTKEKKEIEILNTELETTKDREKKLRELQDYTSRDKETYYLGYHFEKTYRLIFPSQMVILNALKNINAEITDDFAKSIFPNTIWAQQYNVTYDQFIGFLIFSGLIEYNNNKMKLSPLGRTFMDYLKNNNIHLKIPATDQIPVIPQV